MKIFAPALVVLTVVTCSSAFATEKAPAPFFAASSASAPKSPAKAPATSSFWGEGTCVGTCTASCESGATEEHYDVTSGWCCTYYMFHTCADGSNAGSVEWWPTFSTGVGQCDAVLCS
jgi:hypothetical protein